ncbi:TonB-dependent receptor [Puia dinghuensis]|uniref:TonB-dependent receptor n=1 Tax=Puia dinghuensis TaxID=1792502 RepID=UPI001668809E|nr:TonB-dependent receptor [Puia dinghuensis]
MRKLVAILIFSFLFADFAMAQQAAGQGAPGAKPGAPGGRPGGPGGAPPSIGRAYGKVTDSTGQPIAATAIVLKSVTDAATKKKKLVLIKGMDTKSNGEFNFEDLPIVQPLVVRLSATGYKTQDVSFTIIPASAQSTPAPAGQANSNPFGAMPSFEKDLGSVKLATAVAELATATVTGKTPPMKLELDKKVFNVAQNIVSAGGTGVDVMRNVPSVNVDIDGNVTLRGSTPTIFIDGRPTTLTLDEIPADAIESVEVMTNPSAKYDASGGGAGIINIVLKKNRKQGYNGSISTGIDSHGQPNALVGLSLRQNKVNFTLNGMYNAMNPKTTGSTDRYTYLSDTTTHLLQQDLQRGKGHFMFGQAGMDWFITNKTTVSGSYIRVDGAFKPTDISNIRTDILTNARDSTIYSIRSTNNDREFHVNGAQLGMKHTWDKKGEEWTADASFFDVNSSLTSYYTTNYFQGQPGSAVAYSTLQKQTGTAAPRFWTIQTDYVNPLGEKTKLEAGLRTSIQKLQNDNNTYTVDDKGNSTLNPYGTSDYTSTNTVYAAYVNFTSAIGNFGYALGLRGESSKYTGDLLNTPKQHFENSYPTALFPSVFLSYKLKHNQELQVSSTRKINRPGFFQLIPFTDYSDTLNITRGNPNLVPEFTYNTELSYMKTFPHNNTLLVSAYYKYTSNLITRYQDSGTNPIGKPILINTYENASNAYTVGGEITSTDNITKWWDVTLNVNVYNSHINTNNLNQPSQPALWTWFGKFNSNFKLPKNFTVQLTAIYQGKTNLPVNLNNNQFGPPGSVTQSSSQGYIKPYYGFDLAVKYSFLKQNAASITASMTDIFRNRWSDQYSSSQFFSQEYNRLKDPQLFRVVFAYRFGKMDLNIFKRKSMNGGGMGDAGSSMGQ